MDDSPASSIAAFNAAHLGLGKRAGIQRRAAAGIKRARCIGGLQIACGLALKTAFAVKKKIDLLRVLYDQLLAEGTAHG